MAETGLVPMMLELSATQCAQEDLQEFSPAKIFISTWVFSIDFSRRLNFCSRLTRAFPNGPQIDQLFLLLAGA